MIEVERKFQPTEEQLKALLKDALFVGDKVNHDIYYDYPDYRLMKSGVILRNRNNYFELKLNKSKNVAVEIENKEEIEKYFDIDNLEEYIKENLIIIIEYVNNRTEYRLGEFVIDIDNLDFGYNMCEIELMIEKEDDVKNTQEKIFNLAKKYNWEKKKIIPKRMEYLRKFKPEIYKELINFKSENSKELI